AGRRRVADPIAVVLAVREGSPSLADGAGLPTLRLGGLDRSSAAALVGDTVADRLYGATGGNPLALLELAPEASRLAEIPLDAPAPVVSSVARGFVSRAASLPERTRRALVLAAASDTGEVSTLARAVAGSIEDLAAAEDEGLVVLREGRVEFRHPLARSAVYGEATAEERRAAHRALAGALPDRDADRRAWHLALASVGPDDAASSALEQAGARPVERSAYAVATAAYERAAGLATAEGEVAPLLYLAGDAAWLAGQADRAVELLDRARGHEQDASLAVRIEHLRGRIAARRGPVEEARSILVAAAEEAAHADPERAVVMLAEATYASFYAGDARAMLRAAERASELAPRANGRAAIFAGLALGMALIFSGAGGAGARSIRAAVDRLEASDELRDHPH